jgi:hypothetical protein
MVIETSASETRYKRTSLKNGLILVYQIQAAIQVGSLGFPGWNAEGACIA